MIRNPISIFNRGCDWQVLHPLPLGENVNINEVVMMVVGNKCDLVDERKVPADRPIKDYK
jgi:hypothetical protein